MWNPIKKDEFFNDLVGGKTTQSQLAQLYGGSRDQVKRFIDDCIQKGILHRVREGHYVLKESEISIPQPAVSDVDVLRTYLKKHGQEILTVTEIADELDMSPRRVKATLEELKSLGFAVTDNTHGTVVFGMQNHDLEKMTLPYLNTDKIRFGVVSDMHMSSKYERLDVLEALYDIYAAEGITQVFLPGNYIDGVARFNKNDLICHTLESQTQYFVNNFPKREGITTYFIDGDDHEGWWAQREGIVVGKYVVRAAEEAGRNDLKYLGYMEADIEVEGPHGSTVIRLQHPGGGSAYAISYKSQKIIESLTGGEKPHILLIGHYHKAEYIYYRNIHCIQAGCVCDQTPFMRKNGLAAHVGGWIVEATQMPDGSVGRMKTEWISFFDKEHYRKWSHKV